MSLGSASGSIRIDVSTISRAATTVEKGVQKIQQAFAQLGAGLQSSGAAIERSLSQIGGASAGLGQTEARLRGLQTTLRETGSAGASGTAGMNQTGQAAQRVGQQAGAADSGIRKLSGGLRQLGQDANAAKAPTEALAQKLEGIGGKLTGLGATLSTAVTAPLALIGGGAIKLAADFQQSMNVLQATSGASTGQMEALRAKAVELGADMSLPGTSATDAGQAMLELAKAGISVNDTLAASKGVLQLSAAAQTDNATAASLVAAALNTFGLAGEKATTVVDQFAGAANNSSASILDIGQALAQGGGAFASMVNPIYSGEQALSDFNTAITQLIQSGLSGSDGATALKNAIQKLQSPTDEGRATLNELGIAVFNTQGQMLPFQQILRNVEGGLQGLTQQQKLAALSTILQSDGMKAFLPLLNLGSAGFADLQAKVTAAGSAQALSAAQTAGLLGALGGLQSTLETVGMSLAEPFLGPLEAIVRGVADAVARITTLPQPLINAGIAFAAVAAAAGPLLFVLGTIATVTGALLSPIGLVIGAIAALAAAFASGAVSLSVLNPIMEQLTRIADVVQQALGQLVGPANAWGQGFVAAFADGISAGVGYVADALGAIADMVSYYLTPGSPPPLLPELDTWGTGAAEAYLSGWSKADLSALTELGDQIGQVIRSAGASSGASDSTILESVVGSRSAIETAIDQLRTTGSVSEAAFAAIRDASGPAGETTEKLARAYIGVAKASKDAERAQKDMQSASGAVSAAALGLADALGSGNPALVAERRATLAAARARQQDARSRLDAAKTSGDAAQQQLDQITALIAAQKQQADLMKEQADAQKSAGKGGGGGGGAPKLSKAEKDAQRAAAAQRAYEMSIATTDEKVARLKDELAGLTVGSAEYYDKLGEVRQAEAAQTREREQAIKATEQVADAQFQYQLATATTAGKLDLLRQKQQGLSKDSAEYYQVAQQIAQLEEQSKRESEKAAKTKGAGGGGGGGIDLSKKGGGGANPLADLTKGLGETNRAIADTVGKVKGGLNKISAAVDRPVQAIRTMGTAFQNLPATIATLLPRLIAQFGQAAPGFLNVAGTWILALASGIAQRIPGILASIGLIVASVIGALGAALPGLITAVAGWSLVFLNWAISAAPGLLAAVMALGQQVIGAVGGALPGIITAVGNWITALVSWAVQAAPGMLAALGGLIGGLLDAIGAALPGIVAALATWIASFVQWVITALPQLQANLLTLEGQLFGWIAQRVPGIVAQLGAWVIAFVSWVATMLPQLIIALGTMFGQFLAWIIAQTPSIVSTLLQWALAFTGWVLTTALPALMEALFKVIGDVLAFIDAQAAVIGNKALTIGKAIVDGIRNGIAAGWDALKSYVRDLALSLLGAAKQGIESKSPSKKFDREFGRTIPQGAAQGILAGLPTAQAAVERMAATLAATPVRIPAIQMGQVGGALATSAAGSRAGGGGMSVGDINVSLSGTPINSMLDTRVVGREVAKTVMSELRYQQRRGG